MAVTRFSAAPGNYGEQYAPAGINIPGALALTSAGITRVYLGTSNDRLWFKGASLMFAAVVPAGTVGLTAKVQKRTVGGTFIDITSPVAVLGATLFGQFTLTPLAGIPEGSFMLQPGEFYCLTFDNTGGTVSTNPSGVTFGAKLAILR